MSQVPTELFQWQRVTAVCLCIQERQWVLEWTIVMSHLIFMDTDTGCVVQSSTMVP